MATPFQEIYDIFLSNVTSYKLALLDEASLQEELELWLFSGMAYFTMAKTNIYNYNQVEKKFNCDLDFLEKQILGKTMTLAYMNTHLLDEKNLSSALNSKDYRTYSPAKQLDSLKAVEEHIRKDNDILMSRYSYSGVDIMSAFKEKKSARPPFKGI